MIGSFFSGFNMVSPAAPTTVNKSADGTPLTGRSGSTVVPVSPEVQYFLNKQQRHIKLLICELEYAKSRADIAEAKLAAADDSTGDHPYHGPLGSDGLAAPDVIHERFHKSIGDIIAGKVMPQAREQMREALNKAPKPVDTSGMAKPLPKGALYFGHQVIGIRLPR